MEIEPRKGLRFVHKRKHIQDFSGNWVPAVLVVTAIRRSTVYYGINPDKGLWSCDIDRFAEHVREVL